MILHFHIKFLAIKTAARSHSSPAKSLWFIYTRDKEALNIYDDHCAAAESKASILQRDEAR